MLFTLFFVFYMIFGFWMCKSKQYFFFFFCFYSKFYVFLVSFYVFLNSFKMLVFIIRHRLFSPYYKKFRKKKWKMWWKKRLKINWFIIYIYIYIYRVVVDKLNLWGICPKKICEEFLVAKIVWNLHSWNEKFCEIWLQFDFKSIK